MNDERPLLTFNTSDSEEHSSEQQAKRLAIALEYDGNRAPFITATGENDVAEDIIELAKKHDIPLMESHGLANLLAQLELGAEIPEVLYLTIAQIIAFVYMLQGKTPDTSQSPIHDPNL